MVLPAGAEKAPPCLPRYIRSLFNWGARGASVIGHCEPKGGGNLISVAGGIHNILRDCFVGFQPPRNERAQV